MRLSAFGGDHGMISVTFAEGIRCWGCDNHLAGAGEAIGQILHIGCLKCGACTIVRQWIDAFGYHQLYAATDVRFNEMEKFVYSPSITLDDVFAAHEQMKNNPYYGRPLSK